MLPRSCLRLADSKSNSSTRLPRRTTTRVSSGWVASISILLGIDESHDGTPARGRPSSPRGRHGTARPGNGLIVVEWKGLRGTRKDPTAGSWACAECANAAHGVARRRDAAAMELALDARS